jgi:uncharacterized membrane protein YjgN (DUF898 family)
MGNIKYVQIAGILITGTVVLESVLVVLVGNALIGHLLQAFDFLIVIIKLICFFIFFPKMIRKGYKYHLQKNDFSIIAM